MLQIQFNLWLVQAGRSNPWWWFKKITCQPLPQGELASHFLCKAAYMLDPPVFPPARRTYTIPLRCSSSPPPTHILRLVSPSPAPMHLSQVSQSADNCASTVIRNCTFHLHWDLRVWFTRNNSNADKRGIATHIRADERKNNIKTLPQKLWRYLLYFKRDLGDRPFWASYEVSDEFWFNSDVIEIRQA